MPLGEETTKKKLFKTKNYGNLMIIYEHRKIRVCVWAKICAKKLNCAEKKEVEWQLNEIDMCTAFFVKEANKEETTMSFVFRVQCLIIRFILVIIS